jgi:hypothetical protein
MQPQRITCARRPTTAVLVTARTAIGLALQAGSGAHKQRQEIAPDLAASRLSMDQLRAAQASKVLERLSETAPSPKGVAQFANQKGTRSIADAVSRIDNHPRARTAVAGTGLSTRDYELTMYGFDESTEARF